MEKKCKPIDDAAIAPRHHAVTGLRLPPGGFSAQEIEGRFSEAEIKGRQLEKANQERKKVAEDEKLGGRYQAFVDFESFLHKH
jgi:hypothetical protein